MDPITQGTLGAGLAQTVTAREKIVAGAWLGALAGMAPDLDVLIQSPTDPLLFLEFHRQFTHALIFVPIGALIVAGVLFPVLRKRLGFREAYLAAFAGYATHGVLDACTTYGTQLFWPFSNVRVAWNNISVVDPFFTLPLLALVITAGVKKRAAFAAVGLAWGVAYLLLGVVQHERGMAVARAMAEARGHEPARLSVKPGFASLVLWKSVYEYGGYYYVDGLRVLDDIHWCNGERIEKLAIDRHLPSLDPASQQARDVDRFRWFSMDYLAFDVESGWVIDVRYSMVPNQIDALWGIRVYPGAAPDAHVGWHADRDASAEKRAQFFDLFSAKGCLQVGTGGITSR